MSTHRLDLEKCHNSFGVCQGKNLIFRTLPIHRGKNLVQDKPSRFDMVATRLTEITSKGLEWYNGEPSQSPARSARIDSEFDKTGTLPSNNGYYWGYASNSISSVAEQTYSVLAAAITSLYTECAPTNPSQVPTPHPPIENNGIGSAPEISGARPPILTTKRPEIIMSWMRQNPYSSVRGRHHQPSSMAAVRSLLTLVPLDQGQHQYQQPVYSHQRLDPEECVFPTILTDHAQVQDNEVTEKTFENLEPHSNRSENDDADETVAVTSKSVSSAETASQLAEGTVRALRDIALEEAMELHSALRYWTERWENPFISWLEAGPWGTCLKSD